MRFFELATQIGVDKKDNNAFMEFARSSGFEIKNNLAVVEDGLLDWATKNRDAILARVKDAPAPAPAKKRPLTGAVAKSRKKAEEKAAAEKAKKEETAPAAAKAPAPKAEPKEKPAEKAPKTAPAPKAKPEQVRKPAPAPQTKKAAPQPKKPAPQPRRIAFPMPEPKRVDVPGQTGFVIENAASAPANDINSVSQKHKRADFKILSRPELPAIFASGEGEYTRSVRSSGGGKRPQGRGQQQNQHGKGKKFKGKNFPTTVITRDPDAKAVLDTAMTLRNLSEALGVKLNSIMAFLMKNGQICTVNDVLDRDTIVLVAEEFKVAYEWKAAESLEDQLEKALERAEERSAQARHYSRAPVITFMGHVDHGKTSLLDKIRSTRIVDKEFGGITQHIGAYTVNKDGHKITFLDTPGHEAFTQMRARGANLTDVVVLVVAADDGVMPQTKEACAHAKNAGVPIVVAINKCDIAGANPDRVKQELSTQLDLLPEEWGGKTGVVEVSAHTGEGIDELLERILLEAEMLELDADPARKAVGYVIESKMTDNRGVVATILIHDGTLHRIDAGTSGLVLVARTEAAFANLRRQFAEQTVEKTYLALVEGSVSAGGTLENDLIHDPTLPFCRMIDLRHNRLTAAQRAKAKPLHAVTRFIPIAHTTVGCEERTLLEVTIFTGVTHQIRAQLALAGLHVINDRLYGAFAIEGANGHCLHALAAKFTHPQSGLPIVIRTPYPRWARNA